MNSKGIILLDDASISIREKGNEWQITSNKQTYKVRKEGRDSKHIYRRNICLFRW